MLIDWFTVTAQLLNFAILAWLMKRFLYMPVLDAIDAREKRIADEMAAAASKQAEAQQERDELQQKNADFDQQRAALLQQATTDADLQRRKLMDTARQDAEKLAAKQQATLVQATQALGLQLRQHAQSEVFAIARKTLTDIANESLEASACAVFIARLKALHGKAKTDLAAALKASQGQVLVRSAFDLPGAQKQAIHTALTEQTKVKCVLSFKTEPELVAGIEIVAKGQKFSWTIGDQLDALEQSVADLLDKRRQAAAAAPAPPSPTAAPASASASKSASPTRATAA